MELRIERKISLTFDPSGELQRAHQPTRQSSFQLVYILLRFLNDVYSDGFWAPNLEPTQAGSTSSLIVESIWLSERDFLSSMRLNLVSIVDCGSCPLSYSFSHRVDDYFLNWAVSSPDNT